LAAIDRGLIGNSQSKMDSSTPTPDSAPNQPKPVAPKATQSQAPQPPAVPGLALGSQRPQKRALTPQEIAAKAKAPHAPPATAPMRPAGKVREQKSIPAESRHVDPHVDSAAAHAASVARAGEINPSSKPQRASNPPRVSSPPPISDSSRASDKSRRPDLSPLVDGPFVAPSLSQLDMAWWVVTGVSLVFLLGLFMPWKPTAPVGPLDGSWNMVLHWAFVHHVDFGHDLIFTFGPWGFIWQGYDPATFGWSLLGWALLSAAFFMGIYQLARYFTRQWWAAGLWLLLVIAVAGANWLLQDVRLFALGALLVVIHFYVDDRPLTWTKGVLTVALALATLMKFSTAFIALGAVGVVSLELLRRRKIPWLGLIYVVGVIAFWFGARQKITSLAPYFYHSWIVASKFAGGQMEVHATDTRDVTLFLLCALALLAALAWAHRVDRQRPALKSLWGGPAFLGFGIILLVAFKAGYVRHDGHEMAATTFLLLLSLFYAAALWPKFVNWVGRTVILVAVAGCFALNWYSDFNYTRDPAGNGISLPQILLYSFMEFPSRAESALALLTGKSTIDLDYQASLRKIREEKELPPVEGSVDVFPFEQQLALANNLELDPRPVIGSYLAYDATLENLNADFLRGEKAPQSILFDIAMIDARYPSQNDALCWPELLSRYDLRDNSKRLLWLKKSTQPRKLEFLPIKTMQAMLGQFVEVPQAEDPIWVTIDLKHKPLYPLISTLYRPPFVWLEVRFPGGNSMKFQLIPDVARNGFLLSPAVLTRSVFAGLYMGQWKTLLHDVIVTGMAVQVGNSDSSNSAYESDYSITFSRLNYPRIILTQSSHLREVLKSIQFLAVEKQPRLVPSEDGREVLVVSGSSRLLVPVPPDSKTLQLQFGLPSNSYNGTTKTDGESFSAYLVAVNDKQESIATLIWTRKLDPASVETDRGLVSSEAIALPSPPPPFVLLETKPMSGATDACWSDIQFK
jgi:hypothetical protein